MKDIAKKIKVNAKALKKVAATFAVVATVPTFALAASAHDIVKNMIGYICGIFKWIGILLLAWGVGQLVLAFKNEDADSKSRAMMLIVCAIILTSVATIINGLGLGLSGSVSVSDL